MTIAITRGVSAAFAECELTHLERTAIDVDRARAQHRAYEELLAELGCSIERVPEAADLPDSVFIEDTAVILDELAILARPGAPSRRRETMAVAPAVRRHRETVAIESPATLDGGDVLVAGRTVYVGRSSRTDDAAIEQLEELVEPFGYGVISIAFRDCLHLKSAVTVIADDLLLFNPDWVDAAAFDGCEALAIDPAEPFAANALRVGAVVVVSAAHRATRALVEARGLEVRTVDLSEMAKAEGGVTCCSLIVSE